MTKGNKIIGTTNKYSPSLLLLPHGKNQFLKSANKPEIGKVQFSLDQ